MLLYKYMKHTTAVKHLNKIANDYSETDLIRRVAEMIIDESIDYENIDDWFNGLFDHGCVSGWVSGLIYYNQTHEFYDKYYSDIETLRYELEENYGQALIIKDDLKNFFAWLAFEETCKEIAMKLKIEY